MQVAAGTGAAVVAVGMRVQPQNAQGFSAIAAMARHGADRADGQTVVAAQQDWQVTALEFRMNGLVHGGVPGHHFGQMPVTACHGEAGMGGTREVTAVPHVQTPAAQQQQSRRTQGLRPLSGPGSVGASIARRADE